MKNSLVSSFYFTSRIENNVAGILFRWVHSHADAGFEASSSSSPWTRKGAKYLWINWTDRGIPCADWVSQIKSFSVFSRGKNEFENGLLLCTYFIWHHSSEAIAAPVKLSTQKRLKVNRALNLFSCVWTLRKIAEFMGYAMMNYDS